MYGISLSSFQGTSEIFNVRTKTWRTGPAVPYCDRCRVAQLFDTFVLVGGLDGAYLDTIYQFDAREYRYRQTWARGGVRGEVAHRLTHQNTVPLPKTKFNPHNREKMEISRAPPSLFVKKLRKLACFPTFLSFWKVFFLRTACCKLTFFVPPSVTIA